MNSATKAIIISIFTLGIYSCVSELDFERPNEFTDNLVIQGRVVKADPSFVEVTVARALNSSPDSRVIIRAETVTLIDDQGNELLVSEKERGSYFQTLDSDSPVQAEVGRGYRIRVVMPDGRILESSNDVMVSNLAIEQLNLTEVDVVVETITGITGTERQVQLSVDANLSEENEGGLYWNVHSTYRVKDANYIVALSNRLPDPEDRMAQICYITTITDATRVSVFDFSKQPTTQIRNFELAKIPINSLLVEGYYLEVRQYSLSRDAIVYWSALDQLVNRAGGIFDSPPGEVPSNLENINDPSNSVFGYFFATEEKLERIRVPDEISRDLDRACFSIGTFCFNGPEANDDFGSACTCAPCCNCLDEENSTLIRPDYWVD